jgi:Tol biopolymer transport system component
MEQQDRRNIGPDLRTAACALFVAAAFALVGCGGAAADAPTPGPIVFTARPAGAEETQLMVINPDGSGLRPLTGEGENPSWSPDGTKVIFERSGVICIADAQDGSQRCLTPAGEDSRVSAWSPDGKRIAFEKWRFPWDNEDPEVDLYVMNADGTEKTRLTSLPGSEVDASWSPDGNQIAFVNRSFSVDEYDEVTTWGDIYVVRSDGSQIPMRLTDLPGEEGVPAWSPDGKRITFSGRGDFDEDGNPKAATYVMNADGSELKRTNTRLGGERSPVGNKLAFVRTRSEYPPFGSAIVVMDEKDSEGRVVRWLPADGHSVGELVWSPDGKRLAFTDDSEQAIWVMDADGGNARRIWSIENGRWPASLYWAADDD